MQKQSPAKLFTELFGGLLTFDLSEINISGPPQSNGPEAECILDLCLSVY